jgi:dephospho-CoA kinase
VHLYGLTGGIATGKSTVAQMFVDKGVPLIDADVVAREVVKPGQPALAEIAARFPGVVDATGALDRAELGARIFSNPAERAALDAITHPRIRQAVLEKSLALAEANAPRALYDAPLLIENRLHEGLAGVVLVVAPREVQLARLMARNQLTRAQAEARIDAQMPLDEKHAAATWVIDNGGTREATQRQVDRVWNELLERERTLELR